MISLAIELAERGWLPDWLLRAGMRALLRRRLRLHQHGDPEADLAAFMELVKRLRADAIAVHTADANAQHYELPPAFFTLVLGPRCKYSSCYFPPGCASLAQAEEHMLALTCERAQLADGMDILELGCGWGSLTLWMAEHYPHSRITAVSNSRPQREFILARAAARGLANITVITCDMNVFDTDQRFDRIVSVEMFEHMRNYRRLLARIAGWMRPDAKLFVHIFTHRSIAYLFETEGADNWMGRYFFTGGVMPSDHLLLYFQEHVHIEQQWVVSGVHYERTANAWLANLDARRAEALPLLAATYGARDAKRWLQRWRMFFMACAELWGFRNGTEWRVCHYLFSRQP